MSSFLQQYYHLDHNRPIIALAPMAGVTDLPFRTICEQLGADYSVTEMAATAPQLLHSDKNQARLNFTPNAKVNILQIIGNDAEQMATAAQRYADMGADIIDINLGCPARKIHRKGAGSALLADLDLVKSILTEVTRRCPVPVTIKTRLGTDHNNYTLLKLGEIAGELGIKLITVHGRTRADQFGGRAQFTEIAKLKQTVPHLAIIANGDIDSVASAKAVLAQTHCDGLMIGRGAVGNPWLFSEIQHAVCSAKSQPSTAKIDIILEHIRQTHRFYGEKTGLRFARKHIRAYLKHFNLSEAFAKLAKVEQAERQFAILESILKNDLTTSIDEKKEKTKSNPS